MNERYDEIIFGLMRNFNWTPKQIDNIPFPVIQGIKEMLNEEARERERERRLADRRAKMRR